MVKPSTMLAALPPRCPQPRSAVCLHSIRRTRTVFFRVRCTYILSCAIHLLFTTILTLLAISTLPPSFRLARMSVLPFRASLCIHGSGLSLLVSESLPSLAVVLPVFLIRIPFQHLQNVSRPQWGARDQDYRAPSADLEDAVHSRVGYLSILP
ncbi:hypothetical protein BC628DRAFT_490482 [Trametes gibbosa]|nr:hypothetical protein BC628DRAFT_490482 [Trametes gibbosa]